MTREELVILLTGPFRENYACKLARIIREAEGFDMLYAAATSPHAEYSAAVRHKILFRAAYVLEVLYFSDPELFGPHTAAFCAADFPACEDGSARRHFTKIMAHLLRSFQPEPDALERIAEAAAQWTLEPQTKVAVKVWAVEVLKLCRERVPWVADMWDDLLETLAQHASPGIACRMRTSWKK